MKFSIEKDVLLAALAACHSCVRGGKMTLPILSSVLVTAAKSGLILRGTDLDNWIDVRVDSADVTKPGAVCVPSHLLYRVVQEIEGSTLAFELDAKRLLNLKAGNVHFKVLILPDTDFPALPSEAGFGSPLSFSQAELSHLLKVLSFAMSTDDSRPVLQSIYLDGNNTDLTAAATDSRRLALFSLPRPLPGFAHLLPAHTIRTLERLLGEEGDVTLEFAENWVRVTFAGIVLTDRLVPGDFPNYRQVIPNYTDPAIHFSRAQVSQALHGAELFHQTCVMDFEKQILTLSSYANSEDDFAKETVFLQQPVAAPFKAHLSVRYLREGIEAAPQDELCLWHSSPSDALLFTAPGTSWRYILMPQRM